MSNKGLEELKGWLMYELMKSKKEGKNQKYVVLRDVAEKIMDYEASLNQRQERERVEVLYVVGGQNE